MNLDSLKQNTDWGTASNVINKNNENISVELTKLANATTRYKGFFTSETQLKTSVPNPKIGYTAWVGASYPGVVYNCTKDDIWTNTGIVATVPELPVRDTLGNSTVVAPSQRLLTAELADKDNKIVQLEQNYKYTNRIYPEANVVEYNDVANRLVSNDGVFVTDINNTSDNGWYTSNAVPVTSGDWYKLSAKVFNKYQIAVCFLKSSTVTDYCSNKGVAFDTPVNIDGKSTLFNITGEFQIPSDCTHIVFNTGYNWKKFGCELRKWDGTSNGSGASYNALERKYVPYFIPIEEEVKSISSRFVQSNRIYPDSNTVTYTNVINQLVVNNGTTVTSVDSTVDNAWKTSNNIPVVPGDWYKLSAKVFTAYNIAIAFLKTNNVKDLCTKKGVAFNTELSIDGIPSIFNATGEFQIPSDCNFIVFNTSTQGKDFGCVLKKWNGTSNGTGASTLILNPIYVKESGGGGITPIEKLDLSNMTWASIGDSTTALDAVPNEWAGQTFGYQTFVQRYVTFKSVPNYGYSGYTVGKTTSTGCIFDNRSQWVKADIYTIMGGINDALTDVPVPVGQQSDFDNKTGLGTYYGALREYIDHIYSVNSAAHIFLIAQYAFIDAATNQYYYKYMDAIRYVSKKYGIPMIDLYSECGINQHNKGIYLYDGTHPNDKGYTLIGRCIRNRFLDYFK